MTRLYRLPNSNVTEKHDEYAAAWEAFARPLCEAFGWELASYDPNFCFWTEDKEVVSLSLRAVVDIRAGLRTLHAHIESAKATNRLNQAEIRRLLKIEGSEGDEVAAR